ncbi:muscle M-line assembly protein unc-89 [Biomphalaria glabrata]|nr:muscle M-line assembly protein unc-89-like [Biomphalaria glabrata]
MNEETGEELRSKTEITSDDKEITDNPPDEKTNTKRSSHPSGDSTEVSSETKTQDENTTKLDNINNTEQEDSEKQHKKIKGKKDNDPEEKHEKSKRHKDPEKATHEESAQKDDTPENDQVHTFNLINPDQLSEQLKVANLDDEQTEELLQNAKKLNAKLRKILRQQQLGDEHSPPSRKSGSISRRRHPNGARASASSMPTAGGRATSPKRERGSDEKSKSSTSTLPPIHAKSGQARVKSAKSSTGSAKSRTGSRRSARPEWNDRFMFT